MNNFSAQSMPENNTTPSDPVKTYARSCITCSKAKAKCVREPGRDTCERCARLKKDCQLREPVVRRRKQPKTTRAAQLEKLENKIEHLVNALSIAQSKRSFSTTSSHGQLSPPDSEVSSRAQLQADLIETVCHENLPDEYGLPTAPNTSTPASASNRSIASPPTGASDHGALTVSISEAQVLLNRYRKCMASSFPFVIIPAGATAATLAISNPVLLHAVTVVASIEDYSRQPDMMKQFLRDASERMLINNEKSLDIVQGILVLCNWYHPYLFYTQQLTNLLHMAIAMMTDMGCTSGSEEDSVDCGSQVTGAKPNSVDFSVARRALSFDEHRALAAIFYITSTISACFRKMDAMPWSPQLQQSLEVLQSAHDRESDVLLVHKLRMQHLIQEIHTVEVGNAPLQMYIKAFSTDLERLRNECPCGNDRTLRLQSHLAQVLIYELAWKELYDTGAAALGNRVDWLYRLIDAMEQFTSTFFSIPVTAYMTLPFPVFAQFAHTFILRIKIVLLDIQGLDIHEVQDQLQFGQYADRIMSLFEQAGIAANASGRNPENSCFAGLWAQRAKWTKSVYDARRGGDPSNANSKSAQLLLQCPTSQEQQQQQLRPQGQQQQQFEQTFVQQQQQQQQMQQPISTPTSIPVTATPPALSYDIPWVATPQQQPIQIEQPQNFALQQPSAVQVDDFMSGDFFSYFDEGFWQSFAGDVTNGSLNDIIMT